MSNSALKNRLISQYGSLRVASVQTGINYYRLSQIVNGWVIPKESEANTLKITEEELKCLKNKSQNS